MKYRFFLIILFSVWFSIGWAQDTIPSGDINKSFLNLSIIGVISTNGEYFNEKTNNVSLGLFYAGAKNVYGFSLAPFNYIESSMHGVQLGLVNSVDEAKGLQLGFANGAQHLYGLQLGFINVTASLKGMQLGFVNSFKGGQKARISNGLQIEIFNIADYNDYPIGFVNIIKDGEMHVGMQTDEMSSVVTTFRSGGRYLYGVIGVGANFSSSIHHLVLEGGVGAHLNLAKQFRIDTEIVLTDFSVPMAGKVRESEEEFEERKKEHDFRQGFRASIRILPNIRIGQHFEIFGGAAINYLHSNNVKNEKIFPSQYWWRNFDSSCFKQVHLGWVFGMQYRF